MSHASVLVAIAPDDDLLLTGNVEAAVDRQMTPFDETKAENVFADGTRWDWYVVGGRFSNRLLGANMRRRKELTLEALLEERRKRFDELYTEATTRGMIDDGAKFMVYDLEKSESREDYVARHTKGVSFFAFLKDRRWCENERLGWFGCTTKTECKRATPEHEGRCIVRDEKTGAVIINWGDPEDVWDERFWRRFIQDLHPDTLLVLVDFHV